jgi:hypothetical protein
MNKQTSGGHPDYSVKQTKLLHNNKLAPELNIYAKMNLALKCNQNGRVFQLTTRKSTNLDAGYCLLYLYMRYNI